MAPALDLGFGLQDAAPSGAKCWWRRNVDREIGAGLLAVVAALAVPVLTVVALTCAWPAVAWERFALVTTVVLVSIALVATQWARRAFLVFSGLAILALAVVVVDIGWDADVEVSARELKSAFDRGDALDTAAAARHAALDKARESTLGELTAAVDGADDGPVKTAAIALLDELPSSSAPADDSKELVAELNRAHRPGDTDADSKVYDAAMAAVAAAVEAAGYEPDRTLLDVTLADACAVVRDAPDELADPCTTATAAADSAGTTEPAASLDVAVASYRQAVDPSDTNKASLEAAVDAAAKRSAGDDVTWLDAARRAPAEILPGRGLDQLVPGPVGWGLLLAALYGFWSWQQRRNALCQTGPVELSGVDDLPHLRFAVLHNLPEPGTTPGAETLGSASSLVELGGEPVAGIAKAITTALKLVLGRTYGYVVAAEVIAPPEKKDGETKDGDKKDGARDDDSAPAGKTQVMVRVRDRYTKETIDTRSFSHADAKIAQQRAGYWAAGTVLARSKRQPSWLQWSAATAEPLATTRGEMPTLAELEAASRLAPDSALLLSLLGSHHELATRRLDALQDYARAVTLAPRYLTARYRLAGSLGMLAGTPDVWTGADASVRQQCLRSLARALGAMNRTGWSTDELELLLDANEDASRDKLATLARAVHTSIERQSSFPSLSWSLLRRSEREATWPLVVHRKRRRLNAQIAEAAARVYSLQPLATTTGPNATRDAILKKLSDAAARPDSDCLLSYNAACGHAIAGQTEQAYVLLHQALVRNGAHELSADWVRVDPDLRSLVGDGAFDEFLSMLGSETR